jgi:hypothetical protein
LSNIKQKIKRSKPEIEYVKTMEEGKKKAMEEIKKQFPHFDLDATKAKEPQPQQSTASTSAAVHPAQVQQSSLSPMQQPFLTPSSAYSLPSLPFHPHPPPSHAPLSYSQLQLPANDPTFTLPFYPPTVGPAFPHPHFAAPPPHLRLDASASSSAVPPPSHTVEQPSPLTKTLVSAAVKSYSFSSTPPAASTVQTRSIGVGTSPSSIIDEADSVKNDKKRKPFDAAFWQEGKRILKKLRRKLEEPI